MNNKVKYLIFFLLLNIFISCKSENKNYNNFKLIKTYTYFNKYIDNSETSFTRLAGINLALIEEKTYIYYVDMVDSILYFDNIKDSTNKLAFKWNNILNKVNLREPGYIYLNVVNFDTIFWFNDNSNELYLLNSKNEIKKIKDFNNQLINGKFYINGMFSKYANNNLYFICTCSDCDILNKNNQQKAWKNYYSKYPNIKLNLIDTSFTFVGSFPNDYKIDGNYYHERFGKFCINNKGEIIYSYKASPNILIVKDDSNFKEKKANSRFFDKTNTFPYEKNEDLKFMSKWYLYEPYFVGIYYDSYRNLYYRLAKHPVNSDKEKGLKKFKNTDADWSIVILNSRFEIINEIKIDNNYDYRWIFTPCKEGLYIGEKFEKNKKNNQIKITLFEVK